MARYIDAEKIEYMNLPLGGVVFEGVAFQEDIDKIPTADVVEVVRCRDCKRCFEKRTKRKEQLMLMCMRVDGAEYIVNKDDFCSYGERKKENERA